MSEYFKTQIPFDSGKGFFGGQIKFKKNKIQKADLDSWPFLSTFGTPQQLEETKNFLRRRPLNLEIGFGRGEFILQFAKDRPNETMVALETRLKWCLSLAQKIREENLGNLRVVFQDAREFMIDWIEAAAVKSIFLFFPDPWWKSRHHRRRIFVHPFISVLYEKLTPEGEILLKTDVKEYVDDTISRIQRYATFRLELLEKAEMPGLIPTYREKRCMQEGLSIHTLRMIKLPIQNEREVPYSPKRRLL